MANAVEFVLKLKDMMSNGMQNAAANARRQLDSVRRSVDRVTDTTVRGNRRVMSSYGELERRLESVRRKMNETTDPNRLRIYQQYLQRLNREMANHPMGGNSRSGGGIMGMLGGGLGKAAGILGLTLSAGAALGFAKDSVNKAMEFEATKQTFGVLAGNKGVGVGLANNLNKLQQDTILGPEVFKGAQTLMSFGIEASKVVKIEKELGDVSMGNKDKFESLTLAFAQTQAAGRLMGQDLLQYINAGFNPLQTMSERWKDFGLKQKTSVGQLKQMMEDGKIGADAVAKAFELATGKGGKFNNMMDQISQTSYGRLQILEVQWENFKIGVGNALVPLANDLMTAANKALDFLDINKTAPEIVNLERQEINTLVGTIVGLNEKNETRKKLLEQLVNKYPDFFGKLDAENVKNTELLKTLNDVNLAYQKRYQLASTDYALGNSTKALQEAKDEKQRNQLIYNAVQNKNWDYAYSLMKWHEKIPFASNMNENWVQSQYLSKFGAQNIVADYNQNQAQKAFNFDSRTNNIAKATEAAGAVYKMGENASLKTFGGNQKAFGDFQSIWKNVRKLPNGQYSGAVSDILKMKELLDSANNMASSGSSGLIGGGKDKSGGRLGSDVATAGPRTINIYFNKEFIHELAINSYNVREGVGEMEHIIEESVKRVLYSAANAT